MRTGISLLSLILVLVLGDACKAQEWRANLPPEWLGVVVVHDLTEFDRQADRMAKLFGIEAPQLVRLLETAGLTDVTDVERSWIVGLARDSENKVVAYPFAFIPVVDFDSFVKEYDGEMNGKSAIVTIDQQDLLAADCGKWALLVNLDRRNVFENIVSRGPGAPPENGDEHHASGVATLSISESGLKWLADFRFAGEQRSRQQAIARRKRGLAVLSFEGIRESLALDKPLWEWVAATFSGVRLTAHFDERGGAKLEIAAESLLDSGGPKAMELTERVYEQGLREGQPSISNVHVIPSESFIKIATELQIALLKCVPEDLGIEEFASAELDRFSESFAGIMDRISFAQFATLASEELPIYGNRVILLRVAEGKSFVEACDRFMSDWNSLVSASNADVKVIFTSEPVDIADHKGKRYFVDMVEAVDVPRSREVVKVMTEMFGPDGILNWYVLVEPASPTRLIVSNLPRQALENFMQNQVGVKPLPARIGTTVQFDASTYVDWCRRRDRVLQGDVFGGPQFVSFPQSEPLSAYLTVQERQLRIDLELPNSLLHAMGKYSQELRQK